MMTTGQRIPSNSEWPIDPPEFVFFLRAVAEVGRSLFGDRWRDAAIFAIPAPIPPSTPQDIKSVRDCVYWDLVLRTARPGLRRPAPQLHPLRIVPPKFTLDEWQLVKKIAACKIQEADELLALVGPTMEYIRSRAAAGQISSASSPVRGGRLQKLSADWWPADLHELTFRDGKSVDGASWLYIASDSLRAALATDGPITRPSTAKAAGATLKPATQGELRRLFEKEVKNWPSDCPPPAEDAHRAKMEGILGKTVSRNLYRELRTNIAPHWKKRRGRPRKSPLNSPK